MTMALTASRRRGHRRRRRSYRSFACFGLGWVMRSTAWMETITRNRGETIAATAIA
jgi:hypothetical protein